MNWTVFWILCALVAVLYVAAWGAVWWLDARRADQQAHDPERLEQPGRRLFPRRRGGSAPRRARDED